MLTLLAAAVLSFGPGPTPGIVVVDEATPGRVTRVVFTGAGVSCVHSGASVTCTIPGGGASPLTTKGDLYTYTTLDARKPVGTDGQCLKALASEATGLEWGSCGGAGSSNFVSDSLVFTGGADFSKTIAAAWATGTSVILCSAADEEGSVEGLLVTVTARAAGSFIVRGAIPLGGHTGSLAIFCTGG